MDQDRQKRLNEVAAIAVKLEEETGVPAQAMVAQWALESQWGAKPAGHANYFGIKKAERHTMCCQVETHEYIGGRAVLVDLEFADYPSLEDSCRDYAWLISHGAPYAEAWRKYQASKDALALVFGIAHIYATDPAYWRLATQIAIQSNVTGAIAAARQPAIQPVS